MTLQGLYVAHRYPWRKDNLHWWMRLLIFFSSFIFYQLGDICQAARFVCVVPRFCKYVKSHQWGLWLDLYRCKWYIGGCGKSKAPRNCSLLGSNFSIASAKAGVRSWRKRFQLHWEFSSFEYSLSGLASCPRRSAHAAAADTNPGESAMYRWPT